MAARWQFAAIAAVDYLQLCNLLTTARLVTLAALQRDESRGAHYRSDFPQSRDEWRRRQQFTLGSLEKSPFVKLTLSNSFCEI